MYKISVKLPDAFQELIEQEMEAQGYKTITAFVQTAISHYFDSADAATHFDGTSNMYIGKSTVNSQYRRLNTSTDDTQALMYVLLTLAARSNGVTRDELVKMIDDAMILSKKKLSPNKTAAFVEDHRTDADVVHPSIVSPQADSQSEERVIASMDFGNSESPSNTEPQSLAEPPAEGNPFDIAKPAENRNPFDDAETEAWPPDESKADNAPDNPDSILPFSVFSESAPVPDDVLTVDNFDPDKLLPKYRDMYERFQRKTFPIKRSHTPQGKALFKKEMIFLSTLHSTPGIDDYMNHVYDADGTFHPEIAALVEIEYIVSCDADLRLRWMPVTHFNIEPKLDEWADKNGHFVFRKDDAA